MTRGKLIYLTNDFGDCIYTDEFNGDMGIDQHYGKIAIDKLTHCKGESDFRDICKYFYSRYFNESVEEIESMVEWLNHTNIIDNDFTYNCDPNDPYRCKNPNNYFNKWFSDYLYLVNATDTAVESKVRSELNDISITHVFKPHTLTVLSFGRIVKEFEIT